MNEKQQLGIIEDLENFAFEIARLCRSGFPISTQDMAIIQLCHRELDRMSLQILEDEQNWNDMKQDEAEENNAYLSDALRAVRAGG